MKNEELINKLKQALPFLDLELSDLSSKPNFGEQKHKLIISAPLGPLGSEIATAILYIFRTGDLLSDNLHQHHDVDVDEYIDRFKALFHLYLPEIYNDKYEVVVRTANKKIVAYGDNPKQALHKLINHKKEISEALNKYYSKFTTFPFKYIDNSLNRNYIVINYEGRLR